MSPYDYLSGYIQFERLLRKGRRKAEGDLFVDLLAELSDESKRLMNLGEMPEFKACEETASRHGVLADELRGAAAHFVAWLARERATIDEIRERGVEAAFRDMIDYSEYPRIIKFRDRRKT